MNSILIGEKYSDILGKSLEKLGFRIIGLPENKFLDKRLSYHTDMSVLKIDSDMIFLSEFYKNSDLEKRLNLYFKDIRYPEGNQSSCYPSDALLNISIIGKYFIYNPKSADKYITDTLRAFSYKGIAVKQGYTGCSVCAVSNTALITSDMSVNKACISEGLDVLYIERPVSQLDGFDYGFIGGSCIRLTDKEIGFTGVFTDSKIKCKIDGFLQKYGKTAVYLTSKVLFDIGSGIII